jgi:hypothetical protein
MHKKEKQEVSRREFLRLSLAGATALSMFGVPRINGWAADAGIPRLNPGFGIREISENEIELYTNTGTGTILTHRFTGLEADIFRQIAKGISPESTIPSLCQKHAMQETECRRKVSASLDEFQKAKLVYYGESMMVFKTDRIVNKEGTNVRR